MRELARKWIRLDQRRYGASETEDRSGVEFHLVVSPYDLPDAVRGFFDRERKRFIIEFKYISPEETTESRVDAHVSVHTGRRSRRLYRIDVDVTSLGAEQVVLRVKSAVDALAASSPARLPADNASVVRHVLADKSPELVAAFAG
ncbi:MAG: hypothetical protein K8T90_17795 [Planctomycetes bacterium]|nr:hypothetical protein [Planctomycetota bacterium]